MAESPAGISPTELIEALYRQILLRASDPEGLASKVEALAGGHASVEDIVAQFTKSSEFAERVPELLNKAGTAHLQRFTNDVSQFGEVWELIRLWVNGSAASRTVVDVGARGLGRSNSYDLMRHFGWRGVLIEANPALLPELQADFAGLDVSILGCAISDYEGSATLTLGVNEDVSSLNAALAGSWGASPGTVEVQVRRLADVLAEQAVPPVFDLLSVDIEGEDIKVLNDLIGLSAYRPEWIIIEASNDFATQSLDDLPFSQAVKDAYALRAQTRANLILQRRHP